MLWKFVSEAIQGVSNDFGLRLYSLACMFSFVYDIDSRYRNHSSQSIVMLNGARGNYRKTLLVIL